MRFFERFRRSKAKSQEPSRPADKADEVHHARLIETVPLSYKRKGKQEWLFFRSAKEASDAIRKTCKFTDYIMQGVRFVGLTTNSNGTYEVYNTSSRMMAIEFLRTIPPEKIPPYYYAVVETPEGNVGKDLNGIFDETDSSPIQ